MNTYSITYSYGTVIYYCLNPIHKDKYYEICCGMPTYYTTDSKGVEHAIHNPLHRMDGPAVEWSDGSKQWYYYGDQIHCTSIKEFLKIIKMKAFI